LHTSQLGLVGRSTGEEDLNIPGGVDAVVHVNLKLNGEGVQVVRRQDNSGINRGDGIAIRLSDTTRDIIEGEGPSGAESSVGRSIGTSETASSSGTAPSALGVGGTISTVEQIGAWVGSLLTADSEGLVGLNDTNDIELTTEVSRTNNNLVVTEGGISGEGHTPVVGQVGQDESSGSKRDSVEVNRSGLRTRGNVDVVSNGGGGSSQGISRVSKSHGVGKSLGERGGIVNGIQMGRVSGRTIRLEVSSGGNIDQQGVLDLPGVGGSEGSSTGGGLSVD
jgi:hypothetical protein